MKNPFLQPLCPICGAKLTHKDFFVADKDAAAGRLEDIAGCSRCLKSVRPEHFFGICLPPHTPPRLNEKKEEAECPAKDISNYTAG